MMSTTVTELRERVNDCEVEAKRFEQLAEERHREARRLRVQIAKLEAEAPVEAPRPLRVRLRELAMSQATFTEEEAIARLEAPAAQLHAMLEDCLEAGSLARIRRGRSWVYAWLAPDADNSARPRQAAPETVVALAERRSGGAVAGTGARKLSPRRHINELVALAEKQGATAEKQGDGHIRITKDGKSMGMASTPRSSSTDKIKKELRDLGIAV